MLNFDSFGREPVLVTPGAEIGPGLRLVFDRAAKMELSVRQSERQLASGRVLPTLLLHGKDRAPDDWFGIEIDLPSAKHDVNLTVRNYPVHRLFPRLHYDRPAGQGHMDLTDVAASDAFATRHFEAREWADRQDIATASDLRLTVLVPSTPWFAMEIQAIVLREIVRA
ncbi:MAG: hypothetical protein AB8B85_02355 [Paracoccaceae bacterium]